MLFLPETNDEAIKNVESIAYILHKAICCQFKKHFHCEYAAEYQVANLHHPCQSLWLVMILNTHAEGVDEDAKKDALLEDAVVYTNV